LPLISASADLRLDPKVQQLSNFKMKLPNGAGIDGQGAAVMPRRIADIDILAPEERASLESWNATAHAHEFSESLVHELVEAQVQAGPGCARRRVRVGRP